MPLLDRILPKRPARVVRGLLIAGVLAGLTLGAMGAAGAEDTAGTDPTTDTTAAPETTAAPDTTPSTSAPADTAPPTTAPTEATPPTTAPAEAAPAGGTDVTSSQAAVNAADAGDVGTQANQGSIWTTNAACGGVNINIYTDKNDVYLNGGPQGGGPGLPDGNYYVLVTEPDGTFLGQSAGADAVVSGGNFVSCYNLMTIAPFADTTNPGFEYKVWVSMDPTFPGGTTKTDNFKVIPQGTASVATNIHDASHNVVTSVVTNSTVHDQAIVTGSGATPTGTVDFTFFTSGDCTTGGTLQSGVALNGSAIAESSGHLVTTIGNPSYSFQAHYNGSLTYPEATGPCEPLTVTPPVIVKLTPTVGTNIHLSPGHDVVTSVGFGSSVHDQAIVTGAALGPTPVGTVTFSFFLNGDCSLPADSTENKALGVESSSHVVTTIGAPPGTPTYSFRAFYNGDDNYNPTLGPCEPLIVTKATPSAVTQIHNPSHGVVTSVVQGTSVHDSVVVTGVAGTPPGGTVDFTFFTTSSGCTGTSTTESKPLAGDPSTAESTNTAALVVGAYSYLAHYNGDPNYDPVDAACEPLAVTEVQGTTVTVPGSGGEVAGSSAVTGVLPFTGSTTEILLKAAAWLLALGGGLWLIARRRRTRGATS